MTQRELADEVDEIAAGFTRYASILRGEAQDLTGLGAWRILCNHIDRVMDCKIISREQYEEFKRLSDEEFKRLGGRTSY
jgi:hypothetical protein